MPTTVPLLRIHLGLIPARPVDDDALANAVDAANAAVLLYRPDLDSNGEWPANAEMAATIWAARLYGRRGSVQGVAAFQDVGVSLLPRLDPDVRALLQLGEYQPSVAV